MPVLADHFHLAVQCQRFLDRVRHLDCDRIAYLHPLSHLVDVARPDSARGIWAFLFSLAFWFCRYFCLVLTFCLYFQHWCQKIDCFNSTQSAALPVDLPELTHSLQRRSCSRFILIDRSCNLLEQHLFATSECLTDKRIPFIHAFHRPLTPFIPYRVSQCFQPRPAPLHPPCPTPSHRSRNHVLPGCESGSSWRLRRPHPASADSFLSCPNF